MKLTERKPFIILLVVIVAITLLTYYIKSVWGGNNVRYMDLQELNKDAIELEPENIIMFDSFGETDFTCTGFTYDTHDEAFWIADFGSLSAETERVQRIIEVDRNLHSVLKEINLDNVLFPYDNLQGIAYDAAENCLWMALGEKLIEITKDGNIIATINMERYVDFKANGVCVDLNDDTLWVLCESNYLLHYHKDGKIIEEYPFNYYAQDHLCISDDYIYITVGNDYLGDENYVLKIFKSTGEISSYYKVLKSNAIEGICLLDNKMLIVNDGFYHSDLIGHSYVSIYSLSGFE